MYKYGIIDTDWKTETYSESKHEIAPDFDLYRAAAIVLNANLS